MRARPATTHLPPAGPSHNSRRRHTEHEEEIERRVIEARVSIQHALIGKHTRVRHATSHLRSGGPSRPTQAHAERGSGRAKESHQGKGRHLPCTDRQEQACPIRGEPLTACKTEPRQPMQAHRERGTGGEKESYRGKGQHRALHCREPSGVPSPGRATYCLYNPAAAAHAGTWIKR